MGSWEAVALPRVTYDAVSAQLGGRGLEWSQVAHVTATTTLTTAVRERGGVALPIATLRDLVVMTALPGDMALDLPTLRDVSRSPEDDCASYKQEVSDFQTQATGRRLRIGLQVDDCLRKFVREQGDQRLGRALLASRRSFAATVHALVAAGVRPADLSPADAMARMAAEAWRRAEEAVEALGAPRELMGVDAAELAAGRSERAVRLQRLLRAALDSAFGPVVAGRRTLVHHGFYFYTPPQWQMFQALRSLEEVDQLFVVHDDGRNPAFASWRYYFRPEWGMPVPTPGVPVPDAVTPAAAWLRGALGGAAEGALEAVDLMDYRSPVDLVRHWSSQEVERGEDEPGPARYAARAEDVERLVQRLGRGSAGGSPQLAQLPVGLFLLTLHSCITSDPTGRPLVTITPDRLLDLLTSGFAGLGDEPLRSATLRRVLPYFSDCRDGQDWLDRAAKLRATVQERVERLPGRRDDDTDADRIESAAANPVRLAPWVDLSPTEATEVEHAVRHVVRLVQDVVSRERVVLGEHLDRIRRTLESVLSTLPAEDRAEVEAKVAGFGVLTGEEVDVDALVDVVAMLVGRRADLDPAPLREDEPCATKVCQLRGLDSLGLQPTTGDVHLTNLAEDAFPSAGGAVGWPFVLDDLRAAVSSGLEPVTVELMATRQATGPLGDLYLLWLALDGVRGDGRLTLSWISTSGGEKRRLSPLVALLARLPHPDEAVVEAGGGLVPRNLGDRGDDDVLGSLPQPEAVDPLDDDAMNALEDAVHPVAAASAVACPRRFAIQWILGPSAGFGPDHLASMLHGNLRNALVRSQEENAFGAAAITESVWAHLTEGQRRSGLDKAVVKTRGKSADAAWVWTLAGSRNKQRPLDAAYQAAIDMQQPDAEVLVPPGTIVLPMGVTGEGAAEICARCPVQNRCSQWQDVDR